MKKKEKEERNSVLPDDETYDANKNMAITRSLFEAGFIRSLPHAKPRGNLKSSLKKKTLICRRSYTTSYKSCLEGRLVGERIDGRSSDYHKNNAWNNVHYSEIKILFSSLSLLWVWVMLMQNQ